MSRTPTGGSFGLHVPPTAKNAAVSKAKESELFKGDDCTEIRPVIRKSLPPRSNYIDEKIKRETLEEDPEAFEYDKVYDKVSSSAQNQRSHTVADSKPKYMSAIMEAARQRQLELERSKVRLRRTEAQQGADSEGREVFVTSAYKKKLQEMKERGVDPDVQTNIDKEPPKQLHMANFYSNIMKSDRIGDERSPIKKGQDRRSHDRREYSPDRGSPGGRDHNRGPK